MEPSNEPISVRVSRINSEIVDKSSSRNNCSPISREGLLDALQALFEECSIESLQKYDPNIKNFVEKYKFTINNLKRLRVNAADFEIKSVIGRGHFGEVHVVKEKQTSDMYAMKTIKKIESVDKKRTSFEEERNIMAFTTSSWHTRLRYAFQDNTSLFYIMEYHPGGDLLGLLCRQGGTLPESAATFYLAELILALEDLHKMGYVHRDIKPDNVLLDRCGHIKLADFGSAVKLNSQGLVTDGPPVGTPDYIAPEVLQSMDDNKQNKGYGVSCDFWSLGILAYELTIGNTPFSGQSNTSTYAKIINHANNVKFPSDVVLTQGFVSLLNGLITDAKSRFTLKQIVKQPLFNSIHFDSLKDQVPPYVPLLASIDDTSNFNDVQNKKKVLNVENFKKKTQFSGRNLPFIGFTFTPDQENYEYNTKSFGMKDETMLNLTNEVDNLRKKLAQQESVVLEKENLEKKLEEKVRKLDSCENLRNKLERDLANNIAECTALKRTLKLERKDRSELEKKALDLIKSAKLKWEITEKTKIEALNLEINQQKEKISQLLNTNKMLNEQVQHALKLENQHKKSLDAVENLSRRSVIGLESRLDRVTVETQSTISELQTKLDDAVFKKKSLERQLTKVKEKELNLTLKHTNLEEHYNALKNKMAEAEGIITVLSKKVTLLEEESKENDIYKTEISTLMLKIDDSQKTIKDLENKNTLLEMDNKRINSLEEDLKQMKENLSQLKDENRKIDDLKAELKREKENNICKHAMEENASSDNQDLKEMLAKYWRMEKDFNNCKIDKRILERELKEAESKIKELNNEIDTLKTTMLNNKKLQDSALLEISSINDTLSSDLAKAKESYKILEEKFKSEKEISKNEKIIIAEIKSIAQNKEDKIKNLQNEINIFKKEKENFEKQIKKLEEDKARTLNFLESVQKEKIELNSELEKSKREFQNTMLNLEALREACSLLENQVLEYEKINVSYEEKQKSLNGNTEKLIADLCKAKQEIQEAKKQTNEEKSFKLLAETKIKRLAEDLECLQKECTSYKEKCIEYKQYSNNLCEELTAAEERITDLEIGIKSYERQVADMSLESHQLKEEVSEYLTQLHNLREINYRINQQVADYKEKQNILNQKVDDLNRLLNEKTNYYKEREVKSDATIQQQTKLIDYLQTKIEESSHKKKTLTDKIFGSKKENQPPISLSLNYKDLEHQLQKERNSSRNLREEIFKLKAELSGKVNNAILDKIKMNTYKSDVSPKTKVAMDKLVDSPTSIQKELFRQHSIQRMHHNIPHRFETKLCTKPSVCSHCNKQIMLGRSLSSCNECKIFVHTNCASTVPRTCGLPQEFAEHYRDSINSNLQNNTNQDESNEDVNVEGWIKVPGKINGWDKHYACLTQSFIKTYSEPPTQKGATLLNTFELKPNDSYGKVILEPLISEIDAPVAKSDLPFILKVEIAPNTACWPPRSFIFMALSVLEKEKWFKALENIFHEDVNEKRYLKKITSIPCSLQVNCMVHLTDNIKVLGTQNGLYSYYNDALTFIENLTEVHHIEIMKTINVVLMIANKNKILIYCDLNHLINVSQCGTCTKPSLKYSVINVKELNGYHILKASYHQAHEMFCVGTPKQLIILKYQVEDSEFVPVRILDTAEPTSCILFTEHSIIVGANKFYEIDLATFEGDEFLDASDTKLKQAFKCYKIGSFPLAIHEVSKNPKEYLICFNEFAVFVDEYGRTSRSSELKTDGLPLAYHFVKPYLYIIRFSSIEIFQISEETCNTIAESMESLSSTSMVTSKINLEKFQCVGTSNRGVYVVHMNEILLVDAKKVLPSDDSSMTSESTTNESDRFSFSSSMVQSLDGHLSDQDTVTEPIGQMKEKIVTFTQTNL